MLNNNEYKCINKFFDYFGIFSIFVMVGLTLFLYDPDGNKKHTTSHESKEITYPEYTDTSILQTKMIEMAKDVARSCDVINELDKKMARSINEPEDIMKNNILRKEYIVKNMKDREIIHRYIRIQHSGNYEKYPIINKALNAPCLLNNPPHYK